MVFVSNCPHCALIATVFPSLMLLARQEMRMISMLSRMQFCLQCRCWRWVHAYELSVFEDFCSFWHLIVIEKCTRLPNALIVRLRQSCSIRLMLNCVPSHAVHLLWIFLNFFLFSVCDLTDWLAGWLTVCLSNWQICKRFCRIPNIAKLELSWVDSNMKLTVCYFLNLYWRVHTILLCSKFLSTPKEIEVCLYVSINFISSLQIWTLGEITSVEMCVIRNWIKRS